MRLKRSVRRTGLFALALTMVVTAGVTQAAAEGSQAHQQAASLTTALSAPFKDWNVQVSTHEGSERVLDVSFDSPLLKQRITNRVYLPANYRPDGASLPVVYYLHGTIHPTLDNPLFGPITKNEALLDAIGPGGGAVQTDIFRFEDQLDNARFLLVAPDTSRKATICDTCMWQDGSDDAIPNIPRSPLRPCPPTASCTTSSIR